jgi:putative toxin-antitoxin system antitoxin component (TIGR02293 family)
MASKPKTRQSSSKSVVLAPSRQLREFLPSDSDAPSVKGIREVITRAVEVIGDRDAALRWMGTPVRALGYATPISLLSKPEGKESVLAVLTRLEHGVW